MGFLSRRALKLGFLSQHDVTVTLTRCDSALYKRLASTVMAVRIVVAEAAYVCVFARRPTPASSAPRWEA